MSESKKEAKVSIRIFTKQKVAIPVKHAISLISFSTSIIEKCSRDQHLSSFQIYVQLQNFVDHLISFVQLSNFNYGLRLN